MADNEDATTPAAPEEQSQQEGGATRQHNSDSWVIVDEPDRPAEKSEEKAAEPEPEKPAEPEPELEKPAEPEQEPEKPAEPEAEGEPEKPAEPEPEPESEKPAEPEPELEKPAELEAQPETEPEKPAEPEPEAEKPAEPEPEEKPSEEETKPEESGEKKEEEQPTAAAEVEQPKDEGAKEEDKPADQEKPAEPEPAAASEEGEKKEEGKPAEDEAAATTSGESRDSVTVEVTVDVSGTPAPAATEEPKEEKLPEPGEEIHFGQYLRQLKLGSDLLKIKKNKNFPRIYRLDEDLQSISWNSHHKKAIKAKINVSVITEVRGGKSTDSFKISNSTHSPDLCFSIIYIDGKDSKTLDLAAMTEEDRKAWVEGLKALVREEEDKFSTKIRDRWLKDLFDSADKNGDGTLDLKEVLQMMKTLNVGVSKKVVKKMFKDADSNGDYDGKLSFDEFCSLFKELASRPELRRLFYLYSSKMEWWTVQDLQRFLQTEQGADNPSIELCTQIIQRYETTAAGKEQNQMSLDGFTQFMLGPESDIFNIDHGQVYQDMSQPLSAYFIASSHNTYLLEDQLKGPSSCEAYINALKRGCRCVELDCWDGPDNEPIIYHGHTLTSKILFKDAIQVIKDYAFQASQYPVILSIENHCSIPQQHRMADIMEEIFGDMLFKAQRDEESHLLPSPNQLKHKILIKGKKLPKTLEEAGNDDGEVSDEDEAAELDADELSKIQPQPAEGEAATAATEASGEQPKAEDKPAEGGEGQKEPEAETTAVAKTEEPPKKEEEGGDKTKEEQEQPKPQGEEEAEKPKEDEKPKEESGGEEQPKEGGEQEQAAAASGEAAGASAGAEGGEKKEGEGEKKEGEGEKKEGEGEGEKKEGEGEGEKKEGAEGGSNSLAPPSGSPSKAEKVKRVLSFRSRQKKTPTAAPAASARPAKKIKLSYKLSSLINYVQSVHFKGFEGIEDGKCFHMSSFGESSAGKFSGSQASKYVQYNRRQLSRTYPAGTRVTSTNYDPLPMWNAGCQIVALNYQTEGRFMDFNDGRFRANGRSGYILKPDYMRQELSRFDHNQRNAHIGGLVPQVLTIKVISGQQLPKPGGSKKGEVIDPYVKIQIGGVGEDCQVVKTKTVDDNGFNPVWNEVFHFIIRNPDLALVRFKVMDKDINQDDFIGSFCLPLTSIVPGYRHIHLTYAGCRDERIGNATLFVHVQIQDYVAHKGTYKSRTALKVKKSRDYPEHSLVGHQPIDLLFRNVSGPLHKVVDLKEDFAFSLLHFKELCGHGGQADVGECVELLAVKVAAAKLKLQIMAQKKGDSGQVYQAAAVAKEEGKTASVPSMIQQIIEAFNQLNLVAGDILEQAQPLAHELENIYKEAEQMKDGLVAHLKETASPPKRFDQVMDHYCRTMHSLNAESADAHELKQEAEKELKKIVAGIRSAGLELKTAA